MSLTLGGLAAALIYKAVEKAGETAVEGAAGKLAKVWAAVKERFAGRDDDAGAALARVEDPPAGAAQIERLADAIDAEAGAAPQWAKMLQGLVDDASADVDVSSVVQQAYGDRNVQNANITGSSITVTHND